jgi:WD40 repeat protein
LSERSGVLDVPYFLTLAFPLVMAINYLHSSEVRFWGPTYHRPVSPHMLDVLLFRKAAPRPMPSEAPPGLPYNVVLESQKDLPLVVAMACAVFVCFLVSYSSRSLDICRWLDLALQRSGCIGQLSYGSTVEEVAYSPDGRLLAAGGAENVVQIWNVDDGQPVRTLPHLDWVEHLAFSPDGDTLATWSWDDKVRIWGVKEGALIRVLEPDIGDVTDLLYSPDGKTIAAGGTTGPDMGAVWLWSAEDGTLIRTFPAYMDHVAFTPDGKQIAYQDEVRQIALQRISDGEVVKRLPLPIDGVLDLYYSPDGSQLAALSDRAVYFIMATDGMVVRTLDLGGEYTYRNALSSDWKYFAVPVGRYDETVSLSLWPLSSGGLASRWPVGRATINSIAYAPDNSTIATAMGYDLIRIWRLPKQ